MSISAKEYKSPARKLIAFFEKSRDGWKAKCAQVTYRAKKLQQRVTYLSARNEELKQKVRDLERELAVLRAGERERIEELEEVKKKRSPQERNSRLAPCLSR
jgi:chromosome segregation ATPase